MCLESILFISFAILILHQYLIIVCYLHQLWQTHSFKKLPSVSEQYLLGYMVVFNTSL